MGMCHDTFSAWYSSCKFIRICGFSLPSGRRFEPITPYPARYIRIGHRGGISEDKKNCHSTGRTGSAGIVAVLVFGDMVADDLREVNRKFTPGWGKIAT